jgi:hypothetical protein
MIQLMTRGCFAAFVLAVRPALLRGGLSTARRPAGTPDNSPAIYRWVWRNSKKPI